MLQPMSLQHPYRSSGQGMDIGNMGAMKLFLFMAFFFVIISLSG